MMTAGQSQALWQLREIAAADKLAVDIETVKEPDETNQFVRITVSLRLGQTDFAEGGLRLRERETFLFCIPPGFPFRKPEVYVGHKRFAGKPHVQFVHYLCLYQSQTEWDPSDGMFGLVDRLEQWLRKGALDQLDGDGQPLHPPAVYADYQNGKLFVPKKDAPQFESAYWLGLARLETHPHRIEITDWYDLSNLPGDGHCAVSVLFSKPMPWEYPTKGADLIRECERQGVAKEFLFGILKASSTLTPVGQPIYFIMGAPMRGIAGGPRKQHLSIWSIDSKTSDYIRNSIAKVTDTAEIAEIRAQLENLVVQGLEASSIIWCPVMEARPEVTIRRDKGSNLGYFLGRSVSIWGCGALGGHIAIFLCRAGVKKLILRDKGTVNPGILVRQPYVPDDVGLAKTSALRNRLLSINPLLDVQIDNANIETQLAAPGFDWTDGCDVVIDASASDTVRRRLEIAWQRETSRRVPVGAAMVDQKATSLITAVIGTDYSGAIWDMFRRTKLELLRSRNLKPFADSFFPKDSAVAIFQPEPGCSEPTFVGSSADSAAMAALAINNIAKELKQQQQNLGVSQLFVQPCERSENTSARFEFHPDFIVPLADGQIRISDSALREMKAWIAQNGRVRKRTVETGGLLWGEWDDATGIIWVTDASGPPPDSHHAEDLFLCGTKGTKREHETRSASSRLSVGYVGMWHTHPVSRPFPSKVDYTGMHQILTCGDLPPRKNVLFIIGKYNGRDTLGAYLFRRLQGDQQGAIHQLLEGRRHLPDLFL